MLMSLNSFFWVGRTLCDTGASHGGRRDQSRMQLPYHTCPPARVSQTRRAAAPGRNIRSRFVFCGRQRPWQDEGRGEENVCRAFGAPGAADSHAKLVLLCRARVGPTNQPENADCHTKSCLRHVLRRATFQTQHQTTMTTDFPMWNHFSPLLVAGTSNALQQLQL